MLSLSPAAVDFVRALIFSALIASITAPIIASWRTDRAGRG